MRLIDLIEMYSKKKKLPERIRISDQNYTYDEKINDYRNERTKYSYFGNESFFVSDLFHTEVEIIEEDKLEKINYNRFISAKNKLMIKTINKLIDKINELEKKERGN